LTNRAEDDVPKIVASVMVSIPRLTLRTGFAYLRMKRDIRRSSKVLMRGLIENGVPKDSARALAMNYEADLSVRNILKGVSGAARREESVDSSQHLNKIHWIVG
jgi:hypothetical protein